MKSPEDARATMVANLPAKTGRSLVEWIKIVERSKLASHGQIVALLKAEHGVGHGYANLIAHEALRAASGAANDGKDLLAAQYAGPRAALHPIYDALTAAIREFGGDVEVAPKKTYVSVRRSKQFAILQPSTATRLDVGINLKGVAPTRRLELSGSFNAMVSHRVRLAAAKEVDAQLIGWLKQAYERA